MTDIVIRLEECAISYEQSGPSAHHTAALLREAKSEIEHLRAELEKIADPLLLDIEGIGFARSLKMISAMRGIARAAVPRA